MTKLGEDLVISGAWILFVGTVISVVGRSQNILTGSVTGKDLVLKGNAIEAFGNSIQAIGREKGYISTKQESELITFVGCWIQATGNITNAYGLNIEMNIDEIQGIKLNSLGSSIQAIGASIEAYGATKANTTTKGFEIVGNELIALGSIFDAVGSISILNDKELLADFLWLYGSIIQAIGAFLEVFGVSNAVELESANEYQYGTSSIE